MKIEVRDSIAILYLYSIYYDSVFRLFFSNLSVMNICITVAYARKR